MAPRLLKSGLLSALLLTTSGQASAVGEHVSNASEAGAPLFKSESFQLTEKSLQSLKPNQSAVFGFSNTSAVHVNGAKCRLLPGDKSWPSDSTWSQFDDALGGALIKTVPLAASCYQSWPEYDSDKCKNVSTYWTVSYMQ